ncbi:MAG TPA: hypothetical protein VN700_18690 [Vicinamibacterales bacterium]|nr:hypothetical protein [Vicinamibacterales bacterium]
MKFLPSGAERTRLTVLLALLGIAGAVWYYRSSSNEPVPPPSLGGAGRTPPTPAPQPRDSRGAARATPAPRPTTPQALKLTELEQVPDEPQAGRNPFRFGVKVIPPPPPRPQPQYTPPVIAPPPPPPAPEVKLSLKSVMDDYYGKKRAFLVDPSGTMFVGVDGQVIDGRYRLVKVESRSAIVEFLDGTGRRTLILGRN